MHRARILALAPVGIAAAALGLLDVAPAANAATPSTPSAKAAACDRAPWEQTIQGGPTGLKAGSHTDDYLWHDAGGFHLRVAHGAHDRNVHTGVISAASAMRSTPVKVEKGDIVTLSSDRTTLSFSFVNSGRIDGVDFHTDCGIRLTVSRLHIGDRDLPTGHVDLGEHRAHPAHIPFTVHRSA